MKYYQLSFWYGNKDLLSIPEYINVYFYLDMYISSLPGSYDIDMVQIWN